MSARNSPCRCRSTASSLSPADRQRIRTAFDALYEQRYAHHSPDEPVEMVNIRLAVVGKRTRARRSRSCATATPPSRRAIAQVYFADRAQARDLLRSTSARTLGAGARIAGPALIQEHGTTTVLFARDRCTVAPSGELIITVGGA